MDAAAGVLSPQTKEKSDLPYTFILIFMLSNASGGYRSIDPHIDSKIHADTWITRYKKIHNIIVHSKQYTLVNTITS